LGTRETSLPEKAALRQRFGHHKFPTMSNVVRRRVSVRESFKIAGKAAFQADDMTGGEGSLLGTIVFGIWWWIAGVPTKRDDDEEQHPSEERR
jgi:hypothetical protein